MAFKNHLKLRAWLWLRRFYHQPTTVEVEKRPPSRQHPDRCITSLPRGWRCVGGRVMAAARFGSGKELEANAGHTTVPPASRAHCFLPFCCGSETLHHPTWRYWSALHEHQLHNTWAHSHLSHYFGSLLAFPPTPTLRCPCQKQAGGELHKTTSMDCFCRHGSRNVGGSEVVFTLTSWLGSLTTKKWQWSPSCCHRNQALSFLCAVTKTVRRIWTQLRSLAESFVKSLICVGTSQSFLGVSYNI